MRIIFPVNMVRYRLFIVIALHTAFAAAAIYVSFILRLDMTLGDGIYPVLFWRSLPVTIGVFLFFSGISNLYQGIWRYAGIHDLIDIIKASLLSAAVFTIITQFSGVFPNYPRSVNVLNFFMLVLFTGGTRFGIRLFREHFTPESQFTTNILIVGAGKTGTELAHNLRMAKGREYIPAGFIDENRALHGHHIHNIRVLGGLDTIRTAVRKHHIQEIFIAVPEADNELVNSVIEKARIPDWDIRFKIVPSKLDILTGKFEVTQIRDVSINDLLSRPNIKIDDTMVRRQLSGSRILITGAGGSIGSEICAQCAAYSPSKIIMLDLNEDNIAKISSEITSRFTVPVQCHAGSILDERLLIDIFEQSRPDYIFHAAAYKHVHLMEWNPFSCLNVNVLGTATLARCAERMNVREFVMISTDKAVKPKGIMGLSKRLAERVVLERANSGTKFNVVRFGNVLGSSGSVIPLFQKQIQNGGPVTVTSPDVKRFFMSIPEAVQLVLQASTLEDRNSIYMLDMGNPVNISDLAKNLISLSGLRPGEDIEIVYTGLRPGEKIEEELQSIKENLTATRYDKIRKLKNSSNDPETMRKFTALLAENIERANIKAIYKEITELVPEMTGPSFEEITDRLFG